MQPSYALRVAEGQYHMPSANSVIKLDRHVSKTKWNSNTDFPPGRTFLTHWGRVAQLCVGRLVIIGSDNGLPPDRRQAFIWTNYGLLSIGLLQTYFSGNIIKIHQFPLTKMHVKMSSAKWRPSCLGFNVLTKISPKNAESMTWISDYIPRKL